MCTLLGRDLNATIMSVRRLRIDATLLRECEFTMAWNMRSSLRSLRRLNSRALMVVARVSVRQREREQAPRTGGHPCRHLPQILYTSPSRKAHGAKQIIKRRRTGACVVVMVNG